ncbi:MAG TPA: hypothetical protein VGZ90_12890 [Puia sp.]|jgi:hypothetical protein|nr:hypothetical protein [Puia sp.]
MKKLVFLLFVIMLPASFLMAQPQPQNISVEVIIGSRPPSPSEAQLMRAEEMNHPNITTAMHDIEKSMKALHAAPSDFGGHKAQAESDLKQAWISLRKALYFRLYKDTH